MPDDGLSAEARAQSVAQAQTLRKQGKVPSVDTLKNLQPVIPEISVPWVAGQEVFEHYLSYAPLSGSHDTIALRSRRGWESMVLLRASRLQLP